MRLLNLIKSIFAYIGAVLFLGIFGPGFMAVGWNRIAAECRRDAKVDCSFTDAYLFGLVTFRSRVFGVRSVENAVHHSAGFDGLITSKVQVVGDSGSAPVSRLSSNFGDAQKFRMVRALENFLSSSNPTFSHSEVTVSSPFLLFSFPLTLLFLVTAFGPLYFFLRPRENVSTLAYDRWTKRKSALPPPLTSPLPPVNPLPKYARYVATFFAVVVTGQLWLFHLGYLGTWLEIVPTAMALWGAISVARTRT